MKTLNRTLSLALVFALVFSLMSFAFAATTTTTTTTTAATKLSDFTDASKLTYTEAADYLISAGIVKGATSTTLVPQGELTREQAAKMIAYACLGQVAADNLKATSAPFTDVPADRWSAGYVAYCQKNGIIGGYGNGNFGPNDKVTGYQYAKMLLTSIGYGVNGEFTGNGWDLEVAKLSLACGIFEGNNAGASSEPANREQAFLYTFNTLSNLRNVSYNKSLGIYYVPGDSAMGTNPVVPTSDTTHKTSVGAVKFNMVKTADDGTYTEAAHYWAINGKSVTDTYPDAPIAKLASAANGTPYENLTVKGNAEYIGYSANDTVNYYLNGDASTKTAVTNAAAIRGNVINFYDTNKDGKYDTVEALVYKVVKLTSAPTVVTAGSSTVVTIADMGMSKIVSSNITGDYKSLAKDDYVLYYSNAKGTKWTIAKCETVTGQLYGFNSTSFALNVNGTNVNASYISKNGQATTAAADAAFSTVWTSITNTKGLAGTTFYYDAGKNICAAKAAQDIVAAGNVVFVLEKTANLSVVSAKLLQSDGSTVIKTISKVTDTNNVTKSITVDTDVAQYSFYTYTANTDGSYTLKAIGGTKDNTNAYQLAGATYTTAGKAVFTKGTASFFTNDGGTALGSLATSATVFVLEGDTSNTLNSYKAYTGISTIPTVKSYDYNNDKVVNTSDTAAYVLNDKDGYAIMAVALRGDLDNTTATLDYTFIGSTPSKVTMTSNASDDYYKYYYSTLNGAIKDVDATLTSNVTPGLHAIDSYEGTKVAGVVAAGGEPGTRLERVIWNLMAPTTPATAAHDLLNVENGTGGFKVNGNTVSFTSAGNTSESFVVTNDVKVFYHDCTNLKTTGKITLEQQSGVAALENLPKTDAKTMYTYGVSALSVSKDDHTVNELYITKYPTTDLTSGTGTTVTTTGTVTYVDTGTSPYVIVGTTQYPLIGSALEFFQDGAVVVGDSISYTLTSAATPQMLAVTAINPKSGTVTFNATHTVSAFSGLTVGGNLKFDGVASFTASDITVTGNLVVGDLNTDATALTATNFNVTGTTDIKSNGAVSFTSSEFKGNVTADMGAAGTATFTKGTFDGNVEIKVTNAAGNANFEACTVAGDFTATDDATFKGSVAVNGKINGAAKITVAAASGVGGTIDTATQNAVALAAAQNTVDAVTIGQGANAGEVKLTNSATTMEYSTDNGVNYIDCTANMDLDANIGATIIVRMKATTKATKTFTVTAADIKPAAAPTISAATVADGSSKNVTITGSSLATTANTYEVKVLRGSTVVADWTKVTFTAATGGSVTLSAEVKTNDVIYVRAAATTAKPASLEASEAVTSA